MNMQFLVSYQARPLVFVAECCKKTNDANRGCDWQSDSSCYRSAGHPDREEDGHSCY